VLVPDTVAFALSVLHVPPVVVLVSVVPEPSHTDAIPPMAAGFELTVTCAETVQPPPSEYTILETPGLIPATMPDNEPTVATEGTLLVQPPPPGSVNVVVAPTHTRSVPPIAGGEEITVTVEVAIQPANVV